MKKGFTLIELLAVIVVLAVLALIATPIVLNIVNDAKSDALVRSSENYIKAIEYAVANSVMNNIRVANGTYHLLNNGNICLGTKNNQNCQGRILEVDVEGTIPTDGTITFVNSQVRNISFNFGEQTAVMRDKKISLIKSICKLSDDSTKYGTEIGAKYVCNLGQNSNAQNLEFYVLQAPTEETGTYLIQGKNYNNNKYTWCKDTTVSNNACNADGLDDVLAVIREAWNVLEPEQITFPTVYQIANLANLDYTVNGVKIPAEYSFVYQNLNTVTSYWTITPNSKATTNVYSIVGEYTSEVAYKTSIKTRNVKSPTGVRPVIIIDL